MQRDSEKKRKIGLFGGTFNPVHWGHLRSAEEIREQFGLDRVIFIPVHVPPHKKAAVISPEHRCAMLRKAIRGNSCFRVSDLELQRPGKSYSIDTIRHFHGHSRGQEEIYFILGTDAFRDIPAWKDYSALFSACNFIVMTRPGADDMQPAGLLPRDIKKEFTQQKAAGCFVHASGRRVYTAPVTQLDISSTVIRACTQAGKSIRYLVPRAVERYIAEHRLYRKSRNAAPAAR